MRSDRVCDFNRFHPSEPPCRNPANWVTDEAKLPCADHDFLRAVTWCDEHRHDSDRPLDVLRDSVPALEMP